MQTSSRISVLLAVIALFTGIYLYGEKLPQNTAAARNWLVTAHKGFEASVTEQVATVPGQLAGLPAEFRAAGEQIASVVRKGSANAADGIHDLQSRM